MSLVRFVVRPLGYLAFVVAVVALSASAKILGERHELGFFSGRLAQMIWRYPEVTHRGVQMAWLVWTAVFGISLSPLDPIASSWDEVALGAVPLMIVWRRLFAGSRAAR